MTEKAEMTTIQTMGQNDITMIKMVFLRVGIEAVRGQKVQTEIEFVFMTKIEKLKENVIELAEDTIVRIDLKEEKEIEIVIEIETYTEIAIEIEIGTEIEKEKG